MTRDNFTAKANIMYRENKFKRIYKAATLEYHQHKNGPTPNKHGFGADAVSKKFNQQLDTRKKGYNPLL